MREVANKTAHQHTPQLVAMRPMRTQTMPVTDHCLVHCRARSFHVGTSIQARTARCSDSEPEKPMGLHLMMFCVSCSWATASLKQLPTILNRKAQTRNINASTDWNTVVVQRCCGPCGRRSPSASRYRLAHAAATSVAQQGRSREQLGRNKNAVAWRSPTQLPTDLAESWKPET